MLADQSSLSEQAEKNKKESLFPFLIPRETARVFLRLVTENLLHVTVNGLEHIPQERAAILVCNHSDYIDPLIQSAYCKRKLNFLAKKELFDFQDILQQFLFKKGSPFYLPSSPTLKNTKSFLSKNIGLLGGYLQAQFTAWGIHPVERGYYKQVSAREALDYYEGIEAKMRALLLQGQIVSIFPEGTRTSTGLMEPFKSIAAKLAVQMQVPVIPSGISGAWKFLTLENLLSGQIFRSRISYNIAKPILPENFTKVTEEEEESTTQETQPAETYPTKIDSESPGPARRERVSPPPNEKRLIRLLNARLEKEVYSLIQGPGKETMTAGSSRKL